MVKQKGLGAQKVNTDFKEIERAMEEQERSRELEIQQQAKNKEEQEKHMEKQMASMKLAYNSMDKQREKEEAKLMKTDPNKAQQLERLGMAVGNRTSGISHSALNDMQIIQQEGVNRGGNSNSNSNNSYNSHSGFSSRNKDFFDDFDSQFSSSKSYGGAGARDNDDDRSFKGFGSCKCIFKA
jgi:ADP-ribosylation factor GTPase-activating protein 2/3